MNIQSVSIDKLLGFVQEYGTIGREKERTWTYVHCSEGGVKMLPTTSPRYLYRGQTKRHSPCVSQIARPAKKLVRTLAELPKSEALSIIANLIRDDWYCSELHKHPVYEWAELHKVNIPKIEFAQHYGVPTGLIDMTESLEVALFFATHEFKDGVYQECLDGIGIVYRVDWASAAPEVAARFKPIAIQPFARPFRQWAWSCELILGEDFEDCPGHEAVQFTHDKEFAHKCRSFAEADGALFPPDPMADAAVKICKSSVFPAGIAEQVLKDISSDPEGQPNETVEGLRRALENEDYSFSDSVDPIFSEQQIAAFRSTWQAERPFWDIKLANTFDLLLVREQGRQ